MNIATYTLPFPPSVNTYYPVVNGRKILSKKGREYKLLVMAEVLSQGLVKLGSAPVRLRVDAFPPDKRKRDLSNLLKALEDSLVNAGVIDDDSQVDELLVFRKWPVKGGECVVSLEVLD